jgi:hypothetical protein
VAAPRPSLEQAFRDAVDACVQADRPDLLERPLAGMIEILRTPTRPDEESEAEKS